MFRVILPMAMALALSAGPLLAQTEAMTDVTGTDADGADEVLVGVDVADVEAELANELGIEADALPRLVEVPIDVAATSCDMPAEQLEHFRAADQHVECNATTLTPELTAAAEEQLER